MKAPELEGLIFSSAFGNNGLVHSICAPPFWHALEATARRVGNLITPGCINAPLEDQDGDPANAIQPDCRVVYTAYGPGGAPVENVMPACAGDGAFPCWNLEPPQIAGPQCEPGATRVVVSWGPKGDHDVLRVTAECAVCTPGIPDPAHGCP